MYEIIYCKKINAAPDCLLNVAITGAKSNLAVLFLHGFSFTHQIWQRQLDSFLANSWYLLAPDLRGHGQSTHFNSPSFYRPALFAKDINELLNQLHVEKVILCAWSFGTRIVAEYIESFGSSKIAGIALVSGSPGPDPVSSECSNMLLKFINDQPHQSYFCEFLNLTVGRSDTLDEYSFQNLLHMMGSVPDDVRKYLLN